MSGFLDDLTEGLKAAPKQEFTEAKAGEADQESIGTSGTETPGSEENSTEEKAEDGSKNSSTSDELHKEAALWVFLGDLVMCRVLAMYSSSEDTPETYKVTEGERKDLTKAVAEYFATLPSTPKMPPWAVLLIVVLMIYGPKYYRASQNRKAAKSTKKGADKKQATENNSKKSEPPKYKKTAGETEFKEAGKTETGVIIMEEINKEKTEL